MPITGTVETKKKKTFKNYKSMTDKEKKEYAINKKKELTKYKLEFVNSLLKASKEGKEFAWHSPNFLKFPKSLARLSEIEKYNEKHPDNPKPIKDIGYNGINILILCKAMDDKGYTDSRWATFKQIEKQKGHVKAGEKATIILKYDPIERKEYNPKTGKKETVYQKDLRTGELLKDKNGNLIPETIPRIIKIPMFNVEQAEGLNLKPEPPIRVLDEKNKCPEMEKVIANSEAKVYLDQGAGLDRYYNMGSDEIHLPPVGHFKSMSSFYATAAHEIAHSTGHPKRLNRDMSGRFGSTSYAREEMVAELTAVFLSQELNIKIPQAEVENHMAYIQSWNKGIELLEKKPEEFLKVIGDAENATKYIKSHMLEKDLSHNQEIKQVATKEKDDTVKKEKTAIKPKGIRRKKSSQEMSR